MTRSEEPPCPSPINYTYRGECDAGPNVTTAADDLLARVSSEPVDVLAEGEALLGMETDPDARAKVLRAMSLVARSATSLEESIAFAREAAASADSQTLRGEALMTLAGSQAMAGDHGGALGSLEKASKDASGLLVAQLEFQRGVVQNIAGDWSAALDAYERAMPGFVAAGRSDFVAQILHNQGYIYSQTGRLDEAERVLEEARSIEEESGLLLELAGTDHNLGLIASYRGDIPEALRRLTASDEIHMRQTGEQLPRHVSRCEVLLSAGLFHEAYELAKKIARGARQRGRADDEADALLVAARAGLLSGEVNQAIDLASRAKKAFSAQQRFARAPQADLVSIEARTVRDGSSQDLYVECLSSYRALGKAGLPVAAERARILAAQMAVELGDLTTAGDLLENERSYAVPVEIRIQDRLATAKLRMARGDGRGAAAAALSGLHALEVYRSGIGASDVRVGMDRLGRDLAEVGLSLAVSSGRPRRIFRWIERTKARALLYPPVVPGKDHPSHEALVELRRLTAELRASPDDGRDGRLLRRQRHLQEELRRRARLEQADGPVRKSFSLDRLTTELGDSKLLELGIVAGQLVGVTIESGRFRFHQIGEASKIEKEAARLRSHLRRTTRLNRGSSSAREAVGLFARAVLGGIDFEGGPVVVVPPGSLMAVPWAVLPPLVGCSVTVAPSAELWLEAHEREASSSRVVLAAGPDLEHAEAEITELLALHPEAVVVAGDGQLGSFSAEARGAGLVHAACHASFVPENPMFSSLHLHDGDLNVYDMERIGEPPDLMILSACDSGFSETRPGEEITGLAAALLSMGSRSVVASVGLVPDSAATRSLMVSFHRGLVDGLPPSQALSAAQANFIDDEAGYLAAASFICVGGV